jgi:riboflavin synthase
MFTGIVEEIGTIEKVTTVSHGRHFRVSAHRILDELKPEDSIAVSGVCLTATGVGSSYFEVMAVDETLRRSTLNSIASGKKVNLERALRLNDRLGGHFVQGHVDGVGTVRSMAAEGAASVCEIDIPEELSKYTVEKGSLAVDGVSLTIMRVGKNRMAVSLIPYTLEHTTLGMIRAGNQVNIEVDFLGKYVERFLQHRIPNHKMSASWLRSLGY